MSLKHHNLLVLTVFFFDWYFFFFSLQLGACNRVSPGINIECSVARLHGALPPLWDINIIGQIIREVWGDGLVCDAPEVGILVYPKPP